MKEVQKISFQQAVGVLNHGCYIMHLDWLRDYSPEIVKQNPDCSHFLTKEGRDYRNPNNEIVLVIADAEAERRYLGSRAAAEKYGDRDKTYGQLIIENQLLKKAVITFLHDSGSPISTLRNGTRNIEYWAGKCAELGGDSEHADKVSKAGKRLIEAVDTLNEFYRTLWRAVDRRNPPDNEELRTIIADIDKILDEAEQNRKESTDGKTISA